MKTGVYDNTDHRFEKCASS